MACDKHEFQIAKEQGLLSNKVVGIFCPKCGETKAFPKPVQVVQ